MNPEPVEPAMPVRFEVEASIVRVTIDRPEALNAIDPETNRELIQAWERFRDDSRLRVAILTGAGERSFSTGVDVKRMADFYRSEGAETRRDRWNREPGIGGITRNLDVGKPVLAAINGYCLGGGLELALACDIRIAGDNATFGFPETTWAIIPGQGGTQRLPRLVGPNLALEMILTGEPVGAHRAYEMGLVNKVVPLIRLLPEATAMARTIAERPARAVRHAREAILRGSGMTLEEGLRLEQDLADPLRDTEENREARKRFGASSDRKADA